MKKVFLSILTLILFAGAVFAQTPKGFNYQAVVRNAAGQLMANRTVSVRIAIVQGAFLMPVFHNHQPKTRERILVTILTRAARTASSVTLVPETLTA